ncbi:MAG: murein hydrolase activator EnvC family protein [Patescibacteria group bacterium UBA2103]
MKYVLVSLLFLFTATPVFAANIDDLKAQIQDRNNQIAEIERQIAEYQQQLQVVGAEKSSLQSAIKELDLSRNKLAADIRVTENRIANANLTLQELSQEISKNQEVMAGHEQAIAKSLREIHKASAQTLIEQLLSEDKVSDVWSETGILLQFQGALQASIASITQVQAALASDRQTEERKKKELAALRSDLSSEKYGLDVAKRQKDQLLDQTENKESEYQRLIREKEEARAAFEKDLAALETELQVAIDPSSIPKVGSGTLKWPFSADFMRRCGDRESWYGNIFCITQYFGNTPFATQNAQIYSGRGHNGVDFGASTGTPLEAALAGVVKGTGNTDQYRGCYSYGKWVLLEHANGLSTLYAHLSDIQVSEGQRVSTGDVIGYSGNTGYSTGPHLHFAVFASQGVQIVRFGDVKASTNCPNAYIPVAPREAYLNPLSYL